MPFYEYRCSDCQHTFTQMQSMSAPALTTCPKCHHESLVKLISASSCELKGVGVFGNSRHPFKNDSCAASPSAGSADAKTPCASCPHATGN